ncbi:hypothetical protein D3C73_1456000 [compost metagenome]
MQPGNRQCGDKGFHLIRRNHEKTVGLAPVTGDLGQELVGRHPSRDSNVQGARNTPANILGDARGAAGKPLAVAHIQIGLIQ